MVVGAYAVGVHGRPRAAKDLDVWVEANAENAPQVINGLIEFGAPLMGLTEADLKIPGVGLQIGVEPGRIDVLTKVSGVRFEDAWPRRVQVNFAQRSLQCDRARGIATERTSRGPTSGRC